MGSPELFTYASQQWTKDQLYSPISWKATTTVLLRIREIMPTTASRTPIATQSGKSSTFALPTSHQGSNRASSTTSFPYFPLPTSTMSSTSFSTSPSERWPSDLSTTDTWNTTSTLSSHPTPTITSNSQHDQNGNEGAIIGGALAILALAAVAGLWMIRQKKRKRRRTESLGPWDKEKDLYQTQYIDRSPSSTHSYNSGNEYSHIDNYYYKANNIANRGPQVNYPETTTGITRSVEAHPQSLLLDMGVYRPPSSPIRSQSKLPPELTVFLQRNTTSQNPQDYRRQEQLERLLMSQRKRMQELQESRLHYMRENPLSCVSGPHAPTPGDREVWKQNEQVQRQRWLHMPLEVRSREVTRASGVARDPQDWGLDDCNEIRHREDEAVVERLRDEDESRGESSSSSNQELRHYIAQMKEQYEKQIQQYQNELDSLKLELQAQIKDQ
ncbi:hypothetical protein FBU30_007517 [Linnemannia zychae]|nr:hypothetical protein FBU30_007517 [Linnemannia zychae]